MIFIHKRKWRITYHVWQHCIWYGDYLIIPRGTVYQLNFESSDNRFPVRWVPWTNYHSTTLPNDFGQMLEHSPFCERDIRRPSDLETHGERRGVSVLIKRKGTIFPICLRFASFWSCWLGWISLSVMLFYSQFWASDRKDSHAATNSPDLWKTILWFVHLFRDYTTTIHRQFLLPYHHSNIDSDEILYYVGICNFIEQEQYSKRSTHVASCRNSRTDLILVQ